jgi:SAM-dependent methyltransferase
MDRKSHWERVYAARSPAEVSWFQAHPALSLELIEEAAPHRDARILDVGGGASVLVDCLLEAGYRRLAVLDISAAALQHARARLGVRAEAVEWHEADVTAFSPPHTFDLWHDRAVFHFLTERADRARYVAALTRALSPGGHIVIATFAPDGPPQCSGLDVVRYEPAALAAELGPGFALCTSRSEIHLTPAGNTQHFHYCLFRRPARSG